MACLQSPSSYVIFNPDDHSLLESHPWWLLYFSSECSKGTPVLLADHHPNFLNRGIPCGYIFSLYRHSLGKLIHCCILNSHHFANNPQVPMSSLTLFPDIQTWFSVACWTLPPGSPHYANTMYTAHQLISICPKWVSYPGFLIWGSPCCPVFTAVLEP